jgi:hypothetical protein
MINLGKELCEKFIESIKEKISEKNKLTSTLVDLLCIEKEAVYRRLRGEVPFTFAEMALISKQLNFSIDRIIGIVSPYRSYLFQLHFQDYFFMNEVDYKMSMDYIAAIKCAGSSPHSEFGYATNIIPLHFSVHFPLIYHLYLLKWTYQFGKPNAVLPFSKIFIPERLKKLHQQYFDEIKSIKYTYVIWDEFFLLFLIHDIKYFHSIRLIMNEEVALLKEELEHFLDYLEKLAVKGTYETGNKIDIYVSRLNFDATYSYLSDDLNKIYISMINAFVLGATTSLDKEVCDKIKTWMQALKRTSTLISISAEMDRILFFEKQRTILDENLKQ